MSIRLLFSNPDFHAHVAKYLPLHIARANALNRDGKKNGMGAGRPREEAVKVVIYDWVACPYRIVNNVPEDSDYDAWFYFNPVQIKTITLSETRRWSPIKINWASGKANGIQFRKTYQITVDLLFVVIDNYRRSIRIYYIPRSAQRKVLKQGKRKYLKSYGGDSKGTSITPDAGRALLAHSDTVSFEIPWDEKKCLEILNFKNRAEYWNQQHAEMKRLLERREISRTS